MVVTPRYVFVTLAELAAFLRCTPGGLYPYLTPAGPGHWRLRPLDEAQYAAWHARHYAPPRDRRRMPVYDEEGALLADSVAAAAAIFGVSRQGMHYHLRPYRDGHQLVSRPSPANTGRRGGAKVRRVLEPALVEQEQAKPAGGVERQPAGPVQDVLTQERG